MSATRDQSQKIAFVYSNLYRIYQKGKTAAQNAPSSTPEQAPTEPVVVQKMATSSAILKTEDLNKPENASVKVSPYNPTEFLAKRIVKKPAVIANAPGNAVTSLKDNLKALNDLHSRLRFMLQELEDLVKE